MHLVKNHVNMNVFYTKYMHSNLFSYGKITENNTIVSNGKLTKMFNK